MLPGTAFYSDFSSVNTRRCPRYHGRYHEYSFTPGKLLLRLILLSVVSIPILILHKSQMKMPQKLSLGVFLCLSVVMIIVAVTRMSAYRIHGILDLTWEIFWIWTEGCIASIMGSMAAFRTLFLPSVSRNAKRREERPPYSMRERLMRKAKRRKDSEWEEMENEGLPQIPAATLTGVRTFIRRNNRSPGASTKTRSELDQMYESQDERDTFTPTIRTQIFVNGRWQVSCDRV